MEIVDLQGNRYNVSVRGNSYKTKSAEEMFEELGYKLYKHKTYMFYEKPLKKKPEYENDYYHIEFNFVSETINKSYGDDNTTADITLEELKAINKQVEELWGGTNEETRQFY